jgi:hypothetical protein
MPGRAVPSHARVHGLGTSALDGKRLGFRWGAFVVPGPFGGYTGLESPSDISFIPTEEFCHSEASKRMFASILSFVVRHTQSSPNIRHYMTYAVEAAFTGLGNLDPSTEQVSSRGRCLFRISGGTPLSLKFLWLSVEENAVYYINSDHDRYLSHAF